MTQITPAGLYIVATPIGNLGDITLRALDILRLVDAVACEDTRVSGKLLAHYGIKKPLISYNDHNAGDRRPEIFAMLAEGKRVALISDAGTPLVSDPGYKLVREAVEKGIYVTTLPGASSVLSAICLSALPSDQFFFGGFLPAKSEARKKYLQTVEKIPATIIFFESAKRLADSLGAMAEILTGRSVAISREITKLYEETIRGDLREVLEIVQQKEIKGEVVVIISPPEDAQEFLQEDIEKQIKNLLKSHSVKESASIIAEQTGKSRKEIYALALKIL